jgi:hypothetical protein
MSSLVASKPVLRNNADDYIDVDVYVVMPNKSEWLFCVTLDKHSWSVTDGEPRFSEGPQQDFDDGEKAPPTEAVEQFTSTRPDCLAVLRSACTPAVTAGFNACFGEDEEFNREMLLALVDGRIERLATSEYFWFDALGESGIIFGDALKVATEKFLMKLGPGLELKVQTGATADRYYINSPFLVELLTEMYGRT